LIGVDDGIAVAAVVVVCTSLKIFDAVVVVVVVGKMDRRHREYSILLLLDVL